LHLCWVKTVIYYISKRCKSLNIDVFFTKSKSFVNLKIGTMSHEQTLATIQESHWQVQLRSIILYQDIQKVLYISHISVLILHNSIKNTNYWPLKFCLIIVSYYIVLINFVHQNCSYRPNFIHMPCVNLSLKKTTATGFSWTLLWNIVILFPDWIANQDLNMTNRNIRSCTNINFSF
jgi:hypothetical protein